MGKAGETADDIRQWLNIRFADDAFATPAAAWATAAGTRDVLSATIDPLTDAPALDGEMPTFIVAAVSRGLGLHDATWREGHVSNRHAVWPLLRSLLDTLLVTLEVRRNPAYVSVVILHPSEWKPKDRRFGSQRLISRSSIEGPGIPAMWSYLSEAAHFGWVAFVQSVVGSHPASPGMVTLSMSTDPQWVEANEEISAAVHLARLTLALAQTVQKVIDDHSEAMGLPEPDKPPVSEPD